MLSSNSLCSTEWPWTPESPPCTSQVLGWRMGTTILGSLTHFTFILRHGHTQLLRIALNSQSFCLNLSSCGITGLCHQAWEHFVFNVYSFKTLCIKKFISEPSPFWHAFISSQRKALQLAWQSLSLPTQKFSVVCAEVRLMGENEEGAFLARSPSRTVQEPCGHERIWKRLPWFPEKWPGGEGHETQGSLMGVSLRGCLASGSTLLVTRDSVVGFQTLYIDIRRSGPRETA